MGDTMEDNWQCKRCKKETTFGGVTPTTLLGNYYTRLCDDCRLAWDDYIMSTDVWARTRKLNAAEGAVRVIRRFANEREAGETFRTWLDRAGGPATVGASLKELDIFPSFEDNPDFYIDYGETGPYVAEIGASECAT